jgi:hypothetical protein
MLDVASNSTGGGLRRVRGFDIRDGRSAETIPIDAETFFDFLGG